MNCSLPGSSIHGIFQARVWSGLPFPSPGALPEPGIKPGSPALQADSLLSELPGKPPSYSDDTTLMAKRKEELKSLLMQVKEESERASLKLNIKNNNNNN